MRLAIVAAALAAGACQTSEQGARAPSAVDARVAAAQGVELDRICFTNALNEWSSLQRSSVLLREGVDDWYKLDLSGQCDAEWAFDKISASAEALGSYCLTPGDKVKTYDLRFGLTCTVRGIHEWREEADPGFMRAVGPAFVPRSGG